MKLLTIEERNALLGDVVERNDDNRFYNYLRELQISAHATTEDLEKALASLEAFYVKQGEYYKKGRTEEDKAAIDRNLANILTDKAATANKLRPWAAANSKLIEQMTDEEKVEDRKNDAEMFAKLYTLTQFNGNFPFFEVLEKLQGSEYVEQLLQPESELSTFAKEAGIDLKALVSEKVTLQELRVLMTDKRRARSQKEYALSSNLHELGTIFESYNIGQLILSITEKEQDPTITDEERAKLGSLKEVAYKSLATRLGEEYYHDDDTLKEFKNDRKVWINALTSEKMDESQRIDAVKQMVSKRKGIIAVDIKNINNNSVEGFSLESASFDDCLKNRSEHWGYNWCLLRDMDGQEFDSLREMLADLINENGEKYQFFPQARIHLNNQADLFKKIEAEHNFMYATTRLAVQALDKVLESAGIDVSYDPNKRRDREQEIATVKGRNRHFRELFWFRNCEENVYSEHRYRPVEESVDMSYIEEAMKSSKYSCPQYPTGLLFYTDTDYYGGGYITHCRGVDYDLDRVPFDRSENRDARIDVLAAKAAPEYAIEREEARKRAEWEAKPASKTHVRNAIAAIHDAQRDGVEFTLTGNLSKMTNGQVCAESTKLENAIIKAKTK